ncbi:MULTISPECIES: pre-peptidase C-terminal domain-containing protein [Priestia]|uniref:pre-peptidase C-terminal domain-containing protein n=1 Tax=Priestia TaxID=2800373 RepID=UPI001C8E5961|nr:pre-peptidase C-terminal domain-containing protein [Priestia aryabhattai]MBX9993165.1 hypothetical protein [Priestia aryabhattai]
MILSVRKMILFCVIVAFSLLGTKPISTYAAISNAVPIEVNKAYSGALHEGKNEEDFYKFSLPSDGNVTLSMKQKAGVTWDVTILNNKGEVFESLQTDDSELIEGNAAVQVGLPKGTYFIQISPYGSNPYNQRYEFKVGFAASNNYEKEFNNSLTTANPINVNQTYKGTISNSEDKDVYKVTVPNDGNVTLSMKQKAAVSWGAVLQTSSGKTIENFTTDDSELIDGYEMRQLGLSKGVYYVIVDGYSNSENVPYEMKVGFEKSDNYEKEFNNSLTTANKITLNQTYKGIINDYDDKDVYKIDLPVDGNVAVSIKQKAGVEWQMHFLNSKSQEVDYFITDDSELIEGYETMQVGLPKGTYYIVVEHYSRSEDEPYELKTAFTASNNYEKEFNNSLSTANFISLNQVYKGAISYNQDTDVYKIVVPNEGNITLAMKQQEGASWQAKIQNSSGYVYKELVTNNDELVSGNASVQAWLKKGTYFVVIKDYSDAEHKPYEFITSMKSPTLKASQIKVTNNKGKDDVIAVSGIAKGDIVKVYNTSSKGTLLASKTSTGPSATLTTKQVGEKAGKVYATVSRSGMSESDRVAVVFSGEQSNALSSSQVKITNNKGKDDVIVVSGIAKGDIVKVYNTSSKGTLLASKTSTGPSATLTTKQVGQKAGKVYVTVARSGMTESVRTVISFAGEQSNALQSSQVKVVNNKGKADSVTVSKISKGDVVKVYNASSKGTLLASKESGGTSTTLSIKQLGQKAGKVYMTTTNPGMTESTRTAVNYSAER